MTRAAIALSRVSSVVRRKTDLRRWADARSLDASWESRTRRAAALVPRHSRIIEFGAGNRVLERHLDPRCTYVPSDLVDRGPGTVVCNLNQRPLADLGQDAYDVAVLLGVLEYVDDVPFVLGWLTKRVPVCVVSYACATPRRRLLGGWYEALRRLTSGWINNFSEDEFKSLFRDQGLTVAHVENWQGQRLFVFSRSSSDDVPNNNNDQPG